MSDIDDPKQQMKHQQEQQTTNRQQPVSETHKAAMTLLGAAAITRQRATEYIQQAYELGESIEENREELPPPATTAQSVSATQPASEKVSELRLKAQLYQHKGRYLATGLRKKFRHDTERLLDNLQQQVEAEANTEQPPSASSSDPVAGEDADNPSQHTNLSQTTRLATLKAASRVLSNQLSNGTEYFLEESLSQGRELDYDLRKRWRDYRNRLRASLPSALDQVGLATKNDVSEINRKLSALGDIVTMIRPEEASNIRNILERRHYERRSRNEQMDYEQRMETRRNQFAV